MTSTEGLFIRHSDQQPGFLQARILSTIKKMLPSVRKKVYPREHPISIYRWKTGNSVVPVRYHTVWTDCMSLKSMGNDM